MIKSIIYSNIYLILNQIKYVKRKNSLIFLAYILIKVRLEIQRCSPITIQRIIEVRVREEGPLTEGFHEHSEGQ